MFFPPIGILPGPPIANDGETKPPERAAEAAADEADDADVVVGEGPALDFVGPDEPCDV